MMNKATLLASYCAVAVLATACSLNDTSSPPNGTSEVDGGGAVITPEGGSGTGVDGAVRPQNDAGKSGDAEPVDSGVDAGSRSDSGSDGGRGGTTFDESKCTVFVNGATGSDGNGGRRKDDARKSIQAAMSLVAAGDTVCVYPGTYKAFKNTVNGTAAARIHFVAVERWKAHVADAVTPIWNNGDYVDIDGFEVTATNDSVGVGITNGDGALAAHCRIFNNHVYGIVAKTPSGNGGAGILSSGWRSDAHYQGTDVEFFSNVIHDIGKGATQPDLVHGIYIGHPHAKIYDNIVYAISGWGIHGWHNANYITVSNNLTANTLGIVMGNGDDPCGTITCAFTDYYVTNNILYNDKYGVNLYSGPNHVTDHNDFFGTPSSGTNALTVDPQLVRYALDGTGDFHLGPSSPMINAGVATYAPSIDFDGRPRPQSGADDIGPFEY